MKKFIGVAVGLAITLAAVGIFRLATSEAYDMYQENNLKTQLNKDEPIVSEAEAKQSFIQACDTGEFTGANFDQAAYCECAWQALRVDYSVNQIAKTGLNSTPEQIEAFMQPYANQCLAEQGIEV